MLDASHCRTEMLQSLAVVSSCLSGISASLPALSGPLVKLVKSPVKVYPFQFIAAPPSLKGFSFFTDLA